MDLAYLQLQNMERLRHQICCQQRIRLSRCLSLRRNLLRLTAEVHLPESLSKRVYRTLRLNARLEALLRSSLRNEALLRSKALLWDALLHRCTHPGDGGRRRPRADGIGAKIIGLRGVGALLLLFGHGGLRVGKDAGVVVWNENQL
jgi:hypothetical protein